MITPDMIPDEVVEAAAEAIYKRRLHGMIVDFATLFDRTKEVYRSEARAAIAAALSAWPGMLHRSRNAYLANVAEEHLILPFKNR